jgi:hypothetical protein
MQLQTWVCGRQNPGMAEAMFSRFDHTGSGVLEATAVKPCIWRFLKSPQTIQVMDDHFSIETRGDLRIPHFNQPDPLTIRLDTHMWCL